MAVTRAFDENGLGDVNVDVAVRCDVRVPDDDGSAGQERQLRRAGRPEEIAGVAWFLAGPDASYITGQVITVDGGMTITF